MRWDLTVLFQQKDPVSRPHFTQTYGKQLPYLKNVCASKYRVKMLLISQISSDIARKRKSPSQKNLKDIFFKERNSKTTRFKCIAKIVCHEVAITIFPRVRITIFFFSNRKILAFTGENHWERPQKLTLDIEMIFSLSPQRSFSTKRRRKRTLAWNFSLPCVCVCASRSNARTGQGTCAGIEKKWFSVRSKDPYRS